jgi:endonuclease YncB( thermonuclease family)
MNWRKTAAGFFTSGAMLAAAAGTIAQAPPPGSGTVRITGPVRVIEGDTLEVNIEGRRVGVGVIGIVAPAGNTGCGRQAIQFAYSLLDAGVELEEDPGVPAFDRAKRRMYRVRLLPSRTPLALALASAGFANADPNAQEAIDRAEVEAAVAEARANARGCIR